MTDLLIYNGPAVAEAEVTRTGGVPSAPADFGWPRCAACEGPMKFLAQVVLDASTILSIFLCQNDPGLCDEWDPVSGGNRALLFRRGDLVPALVPDGDETQLAEVCGIEVKPIDADGYDEARGKWSAETGRPEAEILGMVGGAPAWLQNHETPVCPVCATVMEFAVQLEEGRDHSINFGSGCGYAFVCRACEQGRFLFQC
jgi:hypothetical protein